MAQDYRVVEVTKSNGEPDQHGNESYWVKFEGAQNSCLMVAKRAPEVGGTEHGDVTEQTSKAGKTYYRFKRAMREDGAPAPQASTSFKGTSKKEWKDNSCSIEAQSAVKSAAQIFAGTGADYAQVEKMAKQLHELIKTLSDCGNTEQKPQAAGYAAFKAAGGQVKSEVLASELPPAEAYNDVQIEEFDDEPIDLSQIPF